MAVCGRVVPLQAFGLVMWAAVLLCWDLAAAGQFGPLSQFQLGGDYVIAGLFPIHNTGMSDKSVPELDDCQNGIFNKHGYHLMQAMRFAIEEINNGSGGENLLPGVTLGYQIYDICSEPASILATLDVLVQQHEYNREPESPSTSRTRAIAVIGPDSSSYAFTSAATLGYYLIPEISYEATNEMLSNKQLYPAFFRTIPSDRNQVRAMVQLLVRFKWTWIALLGSDNDYGQQGVQSLSELASEYGICIAYKGIIQTYTDSRREEMLQMVRSIVDTRVNTIVVFSSKRIASGFFPLVVGQNVTGKVWIGSEDWSISTRVSSLPGIERIGTVLGISTKTATLPGFEGFEALTVEKTRRPVANESEDERRRALGCLQGSDAFGTLTPGEVPLKEFDVQSSFNVYKAVYALAHALRSLLDCDSLACSRVEALPWRLLEKLRQVNFSVGSEPVYFNEHGDPPAGYDIMAWDWAGGNLSLRLVGMYSPDPENLDIDASLINWNTGRESVVPESVCSPECPEGYRRLQTGAHACCFDCQACPPSTFLNRSGYTFCQPCKQREWSLPESEHCVNRTVVYLPWEDSLAVALLVSLVLTLLLTLATALLFLLHLNTPVVKSAGGKTCLLMLASLAGATCSSFCHFGVPSGLGCALKQPLFTFGFTVCLSCMAVRSFQIVCIFKMASKLPRAYEVWARKRGPQAVILSSSVVALFVSLLHVLLARPVPTEVYNIYPDTIILECSGMESVSSILQLVYIAMLSFLCFAFSYMGKDLPANYNEAKCITFSLLIYLISWLTFFTVYIISRGKYLIVVNVMAILASVLGILGGYFMPKVYIIVLKPQMNTTAHFQNCIQMYTTKKSEN
ncbi:taste receptor type 1 member 1 [Lepisosteus oculatus]|uniref:taste receptor type 1 member 1 n=1 Tax=Lepisosteus oculatus TaxID=7918 RepID=UPI00372116D4